MPVGIPVGAVSLHQGRHQTAHAPRPAWHHGVKFMVVASTSTVDMVTPDSAHIPVETRAESEVMNAAGHHLIDAIVTERGVVLTPRLKRWRTGL